MGFVDTTARTRRAIIAELDLLPAENFRKTLAQGVADFKIGDAFCSNESGEMRRYERVAAVPGYSDLGDDAAPLTRSMLDATTAPIVDLSYPAWVDQQCSADIDWGRDRHWQTQPARQFRSFSRVLDYGGSSLSRSSPGAYEDGNNLAIVPAGAVRRGSSGAQIERASRNLLPQHDWVGAVVGLVGSGGVFPQGFEPNFQFVREVVATGLAGGRRFTTFRIARSGGAPVASSANVRTLNAAKIAVAGPVVASGYLQVVSLNGAATGIQVNVNEFTPADANVGTTVGTSYTVASGRVRYATWRNSIQSNRVTLAFNVVLTSSTADFEAIFTVWSPQIEHGEDVQDTTSTMSNADGTNPRAADAVSLLVAPDTYDILSRGSEYDEWALHVASTDEALVIPAVKRSRFVTEHRSYKSALMTPAKRQAISDQRLPILKSVGTANQNFSGRTFWLQTAGEDWSAQRATNKHEYYRIECRNGFFWSGDAARDRIRTEFQCATKEAYNVDTYVAYNLRVSAPFGLHSDSMVLGQFHATEDAGDFAGYPVFELNLHPDGLYIYTASVGAASQSGAYDRVVRASAVPFSLNEWHSIVIKIRFNWTGAATLQFFLDEKPIIDASAVSIGHNDAIGPYWKHGIYWRPQTVVQTIIAEYANFGIGTDVSLLDRAITRPVAF